VLWGSTEGGGGDGGEDKAIVMFAHRYSICLEMPIKDLESADTVCTASPGFDPPASAPRTSGLKPST
jgi:hypothetical protein